MYDATRNGLLRGRRTLLNLSAAHLRELRKSHPGERLVWVDIGGGTGQPQSNVRFFFTVIILIILGYNIELMDKNFPISEFDAVYLIDLCEPLLQVARSRFAKRGWHNVTVLCQDACDFYLPEWSAKGVNPQGSVSFVTLSYSLSMV